MNSVGTSNEITRERWVCDALRQIPSGSRLLDAGAGEQRYRSDCQHLAYVSQDFAEYNPEEVDNGLQMDSWEYGELDIVSDITAIPEPDGSFDAVLCTEVFEHIPDPLSAIREFSRLLRTGGKLIVSAPFCSLTHFAPFHFSTGFSRYYYEKHLGDAEFDMEELTANGNYFEYMAQEVRRLESMAQRYAESRAGVLERVARRITLRWLDKLSRRDQGSSELLCYGYHVVATKR